MSHYAHQNARLGDCVKIGRSRYCAIGRDPKGVMLWKGSGPTIYVLVEKAQGEFGFGRFDDKLFAHPIAQQFSRLSENIRRYVRAQQKRGSAITPSGIWKNPSRGSRRNFPMLLGLAGKAAISRMVSKNSGRRGVRKNIFVFNNSPSGPADADAARELELYIDNDADLYRQQFIPIVKNLMLKRRKGIYDREKAVKLFMYLMESGAKKYIKEFVVSSERPHDIPKIDTMFNKNTRLVAARAFRDSFETEAELGNYDRLIGPVSNPRPLRKGEKTIRCSCGMVVSLDECDASGAVECLKCGQWYNYFGQKLKDPSKWTENPKRGVRKNIFTFNNPRRPLNQMEQAAAEVGLYVTTWAPGDGLTRYRFFLKPSSYDEGSGLYTAKGRGDALAFIRAYAIGRGRKNPLTRREAGQELMFAREAMTRAADLQRSGQSASLDLGYAQGIAGVVGRRGTRAAARVAERTMRHLRYNPPSKSVHTYRVPVGLETQVASMLRSAFIWAQARDGAVLTIAKPEIVKRAVQYVQKHGWKSNPLTRSEAGYLLRHARADVLEAGAAKRRGLTWEQKYHTGRARGIGFAVQETGPKAAKRAWVTMHTTLDRVLRNPPVCSNPVIRGDKLPYHLKEEVLRKFIYRWTTGNTQRGSAWSGISGKPTIPLISDEQWLREHAFHVTKDGRLSLKHHHAEPYYMADDWKKGDPRPNPLLQTIGLVANPPASPAAQKRQMIAFLKKEFRGLIDVDSHDAEFDIEGAIYWFANDYHGGGGSALYSILSTSKFRPGPSVLGPEDEIEKMMYEALEQKYAGKKKNPPISVQWDQMSGQQRLHLLGFVGYPDSVAVQYSLYPWVTLSSSAKRALERQWLDTGAGRRAGTTTRRRRLAQPVGANPLTDDEARRSLHYAERDLRTARRTPKDLPIRRAFKAGEAHGQANVIHDLASSKFYPKVRKIFRESYKTIGVQTNPGTLRLPKPGTKMTVSQALDLARRIGDRNLIKQCEKVLSLQVKANRKAKIVTWKTFAMGSKNQIDSVVALAHYGDTPETMYKPPKGSKKGNHMYRHRWGEKGGKQTVPLLASADGKMLLMPLEGRKVAADWLRH